MTDSKVEYRMDKSYLGLDTLSPPLSGSSRSSPPVSVKFRNRHENRNCVSFADKVSFNLIESVPGIFFIPYSVSSNL